MSGSGVDNDGYQEILGLMKGMKEDWKGWKNLFIWLREWGLCRVCLIIGDKWLGIVESIHEVFSTA